MVVFRASIRTVTGSETKHGGKKTRGSAEEIREQIDSDTGGRRGGMEGTHNLPRGSHHVSLTFPASLL